MRRLLLVAAVVLPEVALAVTPTSGQLLDTSNYNATYTVSYINAAQCAGTDSLHLEWDIAALSGAGFAPGDVYDLYASNTAPAADTNGGTFCAQQDNSNGVYAGLIDSTSATTALASLDVTGAKAWVAASADTTTCTSANEGATVYICAHWYDAATTRKGYATGTFKVQLAAPAAPTGVTVGWGDSKLVVSWTASAGSPLADHYVAQATPSGGGAAIYSSQTTSTSVTIKGLANGTTYDVVVVAYSVGGNPSSPSDPASGTPALTADFWQTYVSRGGAEQGGCAAGGTGALSLLATAAYLALRRRRR